MGNNKEDAGVQHDWKFEVGDVVTESNPTTISQGGVDVHTTGGTEYIIKRRVTDVDTGKAYYQVEWEEGNNIRRMLKSASMVDRNQKKVGESDER